MIRTALCAAIFAIGIVEAAWGQEFGNFSPPSMVWDRIELRESSAGHLAELYYMNSADQASSGADRVWSYEHPIFGVIEVHVHIQINGEGQSEVITVTPVNPQHMAFPPDPQPVADGEEIVIQIGGGVS